MKNIIKDLTLNAIALYFTSLLFSGLMIKGGLESYIIGGILLTIGEYVLKPVIKVITIPLTILSLGIFSLFINAIVLFAVSLVFPKISISAFTFGGFKVFDLYLPSFYANLILSYLIISATIYAISHFIVWICKD